MPDKAWKAFERRIAKSLDTHRTPLSGGASRHTRSDTLHPDLYVECKQRKSSYAFSQYAATRIHAREEKKVPVLALHVSGSPTTLAIIDWDFFLKLWGCLIEVAVEHGWPEGDHFIESCKIDTERKGVTHD